jgi:hypothetical protein
VIAIPGKIGTWRTIVFNKSAITVWYLPNYDNK